VRSIVTYDGEPPEAFAPMSVTLTLEDEIDLSRGDMLVSPETPPSISRAFEAMVVWFASEPLVLGRTYLIKHNVRSSRAQAVKIRFRVNMHTLEREDARELKMNDVASVEFEVASPLFFDPYRDNRATGSLILIDPLSNASVGAAMIEKDLAHVTERSAESATGQAGWQKPVTVEDRSERHGHRSALILIAGRPYLAVCLERALFGRGFEVLRVSPADLPAGHLRSVLKYARSLGLVVILSSESIGGQGIEFEAMASEERFEFVFDLAGKSLPKDDGEAVAAVLSMVGPL
jgi:hypothetical protein